MDAKDMNATERMVLVFGAGLAPDGWMNAKQVVPLLGGDAAAWATVQDALEKLEFAGYLVRVAHGGTWFYRRERLGLEAATRILGDEAVSIYTEAASSEAGVPGWEPDAGAPSNLSEMIGQRNALYQVRLNVDWAKAEGRAARPMLFSGGSGQGKTMVGGLVSRELKVPFVHLSMADADLAEVKSALTLVASGGVVLFDELHTAKPRIRNALLVELGPDELPFTPIAATTNLGVLRNDIVRRFRRVIEFEPYTIDEAEKIAARKAAANGLELDPDLAFVVARAARCNPAKIGVLVDECLMLTSRNGDVPTREQFLEHLRQRGSDERGIEEVDRRLLYALSEFFEGSAGIMRLATAVELGPEHALDRLHGLVREGLVRTAGRAGWTITEAGSMYLRRRAA